MNETIETILNSMDRMINDLDICTKRINNVKIVPLCTQKVQPSANPSAKECNLVQPIWINKGISRRTYYYRKSKGMI